MENGFGRIDTTQQMVAIFCDLKTDLLIYCPSTKTKGDSS
jgi:hypothetical protein